MCLGDALHGDEPCHRLPHRGAHGEQAVVLEHEATAAAQGLGDAAAAVNALHLHFIVVKNSAVLEEDARFLGDGFDAASLGGERRAVWGMGVRGAHRVWAGGEDGPVDEVRRRIGVARPFKGLAIGPDQHEIIHVGLRKGRRVGEHPEAILTLWIPGADVAVAQIPPTQGGEDAIAERQIPLARVTLGLER